MTLSALLAPQLPAELRSNQSLKLPAEVLEKGGDVGRSGIAVLREHPRLAALLALLVIVSLGAILVAAFMLWQKGRRRRQVSGGITAASHPPVLTTQRLLGVWRTFRQQLPRSVRDSLQDYAHFVVLGAAGVGKSTLISRLVDWQGQSNQFLPSHTTDPLLQVYLGRQVVVQELSASLLQLSTTEVSEILAALFQSQPSTRPKVVVIVLSLSTLQEMTPDHLRRHAQLVRGKLALLASTSTGPLQARVCVTGMDHMTGYSTLARFLCEQQRQLPVDLSARSRIPGEIGDLFAKVTPELPRVLLSQPVASFESVVTLLHSSPQQLRPLMDFITELQEPSPSGLRTDAQQLYFFSPPIHEQIGNPFEVPSRLGRRRLRPDMHDSWLAALRQLPAHPVIAASLSMLLITAAGVLLFRHGQRISKVRSTLDSLTRAVNDGTRKHSGEARTPSSDQARWLVKEALQQLGEVDDAEKRNGTLKLVFRSERERLHNELAECLRRAYLLPALHVAVRQRSREKVLYALAAIYASRQGALGGLLRSQSDSFERQLGIPQQVQQDYLRLQERPHPEPVLSTLPELTDGTSKDAQLAMQSADPWRDWLRSIQTAVTKPVVTPSEVVAIQRQSEKMRSHLALLKRDSELRQIYRQVADEAPLDMPRLFGSTASAFDPGSHIFDNAETLSALASFLIDASSSFVRSERTSLLQLLRWINAQRAKTDSDRDSFITVLDGERVEIKKQQWLELMLRSRKRQLFGDLPTTRRKLCRARGDSVSAAKSRSRSESSHQDSPSVTCKDRNHAHTSPKIPLLSAGRIEGARPSDPLQTVLTESKSPTAEVAQYYNRAVFQKEIVPLLRELDKALLPESTLAETEKLALARLTRDEVRGYSRRYCQALTAYLLEYRAESGSLSQVKASLISLLAPDSAFLRRLRTVVDNARLEGLQEPLLRPMADCLSPFLPLTAILQTEKEGELPRMAPYKAAIDQLAASLNGAPAIGADGGAAPIAPAKGVSDSKLKSEVASEAEAEAAPSKAAVSELGPLMIARLSPLAKVALKLRDRSTGPRLAVEQFLDGAGVVGAVRKPFLRPLWAVYQVGTAEIQQVAAQLLKEELTPSLQELLLRFPFTKRARQEASIEELELQLSPQKGAFWAALRSCYAGLLQERDGKWSEVAATDDELPSLRLPKDLWPLLHRAEYLRALLWAPDGARKSLRFTVRALPIPQPRTLLAPVPTLSFLRTGNAEVFGFHQQQSGKPLQLEWWNQGVSAVGVEFTAADSNRKQTQSIEVSDSPWSLHRLLQQAAISEQSGVYWQLVRESETSRWSLGFAFDPEPWAVLQGPGATEAGRK